MNKSEPPRNANPGNANLGNANPRNANLGNANLPIGGDKENTKNAIQENIDPSEPYWHSRGYLPHFESVEKIQHVTFHLADSLPKTVLDRLEQELKNLPQEKQTMERRKRVDAWMDAGHGSCILRETEIARMVQNSLLAFDGQRYCLLAWVIMPNHVHVLFQPMTGWTVAKIVASWKKFTARRICDYRRATPMNAGNANFPIGDLPVWHREYWDRFMRNEHHLQQTLEYIHQNPVKAGLVSQSVAWPWSSTGHVNLGNANLPIGDVDMDNKAETRAEQIDPTLDELKKSRLHQAFTGEL